MKLIAGLGNPGSRYAWTRHNLGFMAIDALATRLDVKVEKEERNALTGRAHWGGQRLLLAKPLTYMNRSGEAIAALAAYYGIAPIDILVICDDLSLEPGRIRLRPKGSAGGHNGLRSAIHCLGTEAFPRLRMGIGPVPPGWRGADFVLSRFAPEDEGAVADFAAHAAEAALVWAEAGIEQAMSQFNSAGGKAMR